MFFVAAPPMVFPAGFQRRANDLRPLIRVAVPRQGFPGDRAHFDPADARRRSGKITGNHRIVEADRFENLRAPVTLDGGNSHLGNDLVQPLARCLEEIFHPLFKLHLFDIFPVADDLLDGFISQVGENTARAVTDQ